MKELTTTIPSTRVYLDTLSIEDQASLLETKAAYAKAKEVLYNYLFDKTFLGVDQKETSTAYIKEWIRKNTSLEPHEYYITSLLSHAGGMVRSQKELEDLRKEEYQARCGARAKKIKSQKRRLTLLKKAKQALIARSKQVKAGKTAKTLYVPRDFQKQIPEELREDGKALYEYELWIDRETRKVKSRIAQITEKGRRDADKQSRPISRVTFGGGKKAYRLKDTLQMDENSRADWKRDRDASREKTILFSGRYDARYKNWIVHYFPGTKSMHIILMDRHKIVIEGITFPYRGEDLEAVLNHEKEPGWSVGYWMEFHTDRSGREYFIMKATFSYRNDENTFSDEGVVSIDMNLDNISWSETDRNGCLLHTGMIRFSLEGKTTGQIKDILGRVCHKVVRICEEVHKPLAMESIDLKKKAASLAYGKSRVNRGVRMFAYGKMTAFLEGKALRAGVGILKINPAYTSLLAKIKYMKKMRCPIHVSASYTIGRRAMGFVEKIPVYLRQLVPEDIRTMHLWKQYSVIHRLTARIPTKFFKTNRRIYSCMQDLIADAGESS